MKATHNPPIPDLDAGMTPADLLRGAALYLTRHGWVQGDFFDLLHEANFPPACSLGAINICAHGRPILGSDDTAEDALTDAAIRAMRVLAAYLDPEYGTVENPIFKASAIDIVSGWNDHEGRTLTEVVETLNDAAGDYDRAHPAGGAW
jgi:hypothetical protein